MCNIGKVITVKLNNLSPLFSYVRVCVLEDLKSIPLENPCIYSTILLITVTMLYFRFPEFI